MKFIKATILIIIFLQNSIAAPENNQVDNPIRCQESIRKEYLSGGWYVWEPYQYSKIAVDSYKLTGIDIELTEILAKNVGTEISYRLTDWESLQEDLRFGRKDIATGATYTKARAEYAYFSEPYRFEENSLFILNDKDRNLNFETISELLAQIRFQNFKIGVIKGFIYADPQINLFISDQSNSDIVIQFNNDNEAVNALMNNEIDGFVSDRIIVSSIILKNKDNKNIKEVQLNVKVPIHLMFSKKTVPIEMVNKFNQEIKQLTNEAKYKNIIKDYLYSVLLLQTIDSDWFYFIGVLGTMAFAVSGISIAVRENTTLFGTLLLAMLPSVGGGIIRDVLTNREEVGLFLTPSYMYYIIITVLIGFSSVRLLEYYNKRANEDELILKFWDNILVIGDALGQAAFIVTGVSIVIMARIEPIELWGPFFAFLTANGGGILRDLLRTNRDIICLNGSLNAELSILWGLIFSIYLDINSYDTDPNGVRNIVIIIVVGAFVSRLLAYYLKIPNLRFREEKTFR
jgi:polar amino acid transport system substrate-binding protein